MTGVYMRPIDTGLMQGNNFPHLFLFEDKSASILTLSTCRFPFFQTFEAGNRDSRSVFISRYQTGVNKDFDLWGKDERKVQLRAKGGKMDQQYKEGGIFF